MSSPFLTPTSAGLIAAASKCLSNRYGKPRTSIPAAIRSALNWNPELYFVAKGYLSILVEASEESPYPLIFRLRHANIMQFPEPIALYCTCPEEVTLKKENQKEMRELYEHGIGVIVVDVHGHGREHRKAIPIVQVIPRLCGRI